MQCNSYGAHSFFLSGREDHSALDVTAAFTRQQCSQNAENGKQPEEMQSEQFVTFSAALCGLAENKA